MGKAILSEELPLHFGLVLLWIAATAFGWFAIILGSGFGCVVLLTPALAALMGGLQRRVLQRAGYSIEANWTVRTALGWLAGSIVLFTVLKIMSALHHSARDFSALGLFGVRGDQVEVTTQVAGLALMGAILGACQWFRSSQLGSDPQHVWQVAWWSAVNAVAWGAGAIASWAVVKAYIIGHEPICVDCIVALFWSGMASGLAIAVVTGFALWQRPVGALLGVAVGVVAAYLVLNNMTVGLAGKMGILETNPDLDYDPGVSTCNARNIPSLITPTTITAFDQRQMGPSRVLDPSLDATQYLALSKDGKILAAQKNHLEQGYLVESEVLIWQTSDWRLIGTIFP